MPHEYVFRAPVQSNDVDLFHCTRCEVQIDGTRWQCVEKSRFRMLFSQKRNSTWNVRLIHERSDDKSPIVTRYQLRFRIPKAVDLSAIDELFLQTLVIDELAHFDLEQFEARLPATAPAREYGGALGDYALGVLLKEHRHPFHAPIGFAEFEFKMRSALNTLRHFNRPVALAVSNSIRFNLNDFRDYGSDVPTELEPALRFFRLCTGAEILTSNETTMRKGPSYKVCPIDRVTHYLLSACVRLMNEATPAPTWLERLQGLASSEDPICEQDLAKIHVICAEGYLRLDRASDAHRHIRAIESNPVFENWAQRHLKEIQTYGA